MGFVSAMQLCPKSRRGRPPDCTVGSIWTPLPDPDQSRARFFSVTKADRAILFHLLGLLALALLVGIVARWLPVAEYVTQAQRKITELEVWGAVLYPLLFATVSIFLLPGGVLAIGAGLF